DQGRLADDRVGRGRVEHHQVVGRAERGQDPVQLAEGVLVAGAQCHQGRLKVLGPLPAGDDVEPGSDVADRRGGGAGYEGGHEGAALVVVDDAEVVGQVPLLVEVDG